MLLLLTILTCPTEYTKIIVNTIIAKRNVKLYDKSHCIHFKRAANINMSIDTIHIKAVKNNSNNINVRGNTDTCNAVLKINNNKLHNNSIGKPKSKSL